MTERLKNQEGNLPAMSLGLIFMMLTICFLVIEMGSTYENYDYCMDVLQRSCNSAVEANIDDTYRADRVLLLNTEKATTDFYDYVAADLSDRCRISFGTVTCTRTPPSMEAIGTVTFSTIFKQFEWDDLTFDFKIRATNYDLDS